MRLIDYFLGWREIAAEGEGTKILTDYLLRQNVPSELVSDGRTVLIRVGRAEAKRILRRFSESGIPVRAGKIRGIPAWILSALRRPGIICGVFAAFLFLLFARGRVWEVRITGDGSLDEDEIRSVVYSAGLRPGMAIRDVSKEAVATRCLTREDLFSGMNVSLSGVVGEVEWFGRRENEPDGQSTSGDGINLVASCDGVIVSIQPTSGTAVVVPGQTVHKGDLLISGVTRGGVVRASGVVLARVEGEFSATVQKNVRVKKITASKPTSFSFLMFGEKLFSFGQNADSLSEKDLTLPGGVVLPFSICIGYSHSVSEETVTLSEGAAAEAALRRLNWTIREALAEGELLKKEISGGFSGDEYTATAKTEYLINIAKPLAFSARNEYNK